MHPEPEDCLFCQIIAGNLDSHVVHETEDALAFLDVNPVSRGHTLVVPKAEAAEITELEPGEVSGLFQAVRDVAERIEEELEPEGINVLQSNGEAAGQEIFHAHVHVIPRYGEDGLEFEFDSSELDEEEAERLLEELGPE